MTLHEHICNRFEEVCEEAGVHRTKIIEDICNISYSTYSRNRVAGTPPSDLLTIALIHLTGVIRWLHQRRKFTDDQDHNLDLIRETVYELTI